MSDNLYILLLLLLVAVHFTYVYFVIRVKKIKEEEKFAYLVAGIIFLMGIWVYAEYLFVIKWGMVSSRVIFAFCFLTPLVIASYLVSVPNLSWKNMFNDIRRIFGHLK